MKLLALVFVVLMACGGGGGSSSDDSSSVGGGGSNGVRILHGLIDLPPLDLTTGSSVVQTAKYSSPTGFFSAGSGAIPFVISIRNTPTEVVSSLTASVDGKSKTSILVYGNSRNIGVRSSAIAEGSPLEGTSVRVVNAADGAGAVTLTVAGVTTASATYGSASDYVAATGGVQSVVIKRVVDGQVIYSGDMNLSAKGNTILVSGIVNYFVAAANYPS